MSGGSANPLQDLAYTRDAVGNITAITDGAQQTNYFNNTVVDAGQLFAYNALYRLKSANGREKAGAGSGVIHSFGAYGASNALPFSNPSGNPGRYQQLYSYDHVGNITQKETLRQNIFESRSQLEELVNKLTDETGIPLHFSDEYGNHDWLC